MNQSSRNAEKPSMPPLFSPLATQVLAVVEGREEVVPRHFLFTLDAPEIASHVEAGQFVHVLARNSTSSDPFLRRAFSVMKAQAGKIEILFRVEGRGTQQIASTQVGEILDIIGPLGQAFDLSLFHVKQSPSVPILVGGGIGVPPLVFLARTLKQMNLVPRIIIGARSAHDLVGEAAFEEMNLKPRITTDDGSRGERGYVTQKLNALLLELQQHNQQAVVYSCGPTPMLRAVAEVSDRLKIRCQVSLEENMPCGIGVCNGCVVATRTTISSYERYRRVCVHGPAMWAEEIDWEAF